MLETIFYRNVENIFDCYFLSKVYCGFLKLCHNISVGSEIIGIYEGNRQHYASDKDKKEVLYF